MVHVSRETPQQTDERLKRVLSMTTIRFYDEAYAFEEDLPGSEPQSTVGALAVVTDDGVVSRLVPAREGIQAETFGVLKVHFPDDVDNSGFVGWLATHLKTELGTGVFVICGYNRARGGIFDYWGFPWSLRAEVTRVVDSLRVGS